MTCPRLCRLNSVANVIWEKSFCRRIPKYARHWFDARRCLHSSGAIQSERRYIRPLNIEFHLHRAVLAHAVQYLKFLKKNIPRSSLSNTKQRIKIWQQLSRSTSLQSLAVKSWSKHVLFFTISTMSCTIQTELTDDACSQLLHNWCLFRWRSGLCGWLQTYRYDNIHTHTK